MKLYGVFSQGKFALTYKKKVATDYVKKHGGEVRWIEDDPAYKSFDSRTFRMISYPIGEGFKAFQKGAKKNPPLFKKGDKVMMSADALENYGFGYEGIVFVVTHVATKYMPAKEFYAKGKPAGYHPGFDESAKGQGLYDLKRKDTGEELDMSLYDWELYRA